MYLCRTTIHTHRRNLFKRPTFSSFPSKYNHVNYIISLSSSMERYRNVIQCSNNVRFFSMVARGLKEIWDPTFLAKHPVNSFDRGQTVRNGHLKHVSSSRGAPNDILIWKIINNLTPTTSPATSGGMCSVADLREPLISRAALECRVRQEPDRGILLKACKGVHFVNVLHIESIDLLLHMARTHGHLFESTSKLI